MFLLENHSYLLLIKANSRKRDRSIVVFEIPLLVFREVPSLTAGEGSESGKPTQAPGSGRAAGQGEGDKYPLSLPRARRSCR